MLVGLFTNVLNKSRGGQSEAGQNESGPGVAVLEPPAEPSARTSQAPATPAAAAPITPTTTSGEAKPERQPCPQCGSTEPWGISSWCPNCFYHPRLGQMAASLPQPDPEVRQFLPGHVADRKS